MIRSLLAILAITFFLGCAAQQPVEQKRITMTIGGNVQEIVVVKEHPCEGNWNFCDHVMDNLDSFYIPAF